MPASPAERASAPAGLPRSAPASLPRSALASLPSGALALRRGWTRLPVPAGFDLDRTVRSHGWYALSPSSYDPLTRSWHRTLATPDAGPLTVTVRQPVTGYVTVSWGRTRGSESDRAAIRQAVARCLALDDDLTGLHAACARSPEFAWIAACAAGRLLRSPTVFEDLVRTLATTNCSWAATRRMLAALVDGLGARGPAGERAFPTPGAIAAAGPAYLREAVRAGYRAAPLHALATAVADGHFDPEELRDPALDDADVASRIRALAGFGPYAAEGMLGLLGRPRGLALDSSVRAALPRLLGRTTLSDAQIARRYAPLGRWAGAGLWLELTRDHFPVAPPSPPPARAGGGPEPRAADVRPIAVRVHRGAGRARTEWATR